jgi:hypothetical protein
VIAPGAAYRRGELDTLTPEVGVSGSVSACREIECARRRNLTGRHFFPGWPTGAPPFGAGAGEERAWERFVALYQPMIRGWLVRFAVHPQERVP